MLRLNYGPKYNLPSKIYIADRFINWTNSKWRKILWVGKNFVVME